LNRKNLKCAGDVPYSRGGGKLQAVQPGRQPVGGEQLRVGAALEDAAPIDDEDLVRRQGGRVSAAKVDAYLDYLLATGVNDYARTPGSRGVRTLRRLDVVRAVSYPEDDAFLLENEPTFTHYDVVFEG
jgi:hypothetical protein